MRMLDYLKSDGLLKKYGLKPAKSELVAGTSSVAKEKLRAAVLKLGFPVVLKAISKDIPCMGSVGLVLPVSSPDQFDKAHETLLKTLKKKKPKARLQGLLVQKHLSGQEFAVVVRADAQFGAVLHLGVGSCTEQEPLGICAWATGFAPLDKKQAEALAAHTPLQHPALADFLVKASRCGAEQKLNLALDAMAASSGIEVIDAKLFEGE